MMAGSMTHGLVVPEWKRVHRANEPRLRHPIPAITVPLRNANHILNKQIVTLNRGGSNLANPILSGLGVRSQFALDSVDKLTGLFVFQERSTLGPNKADMVSVAAPGVLAFNFQAGGGTSLSGTPVTGARRNFIRWQTKFGSVDKEFYVKSFDSDVVTINTIKALNESLVAVPVVVQIVDVSRPFVDVNIDFFVGWNDEFQVVHNAKSPNLDPGFSKAYGGSAFVSWFDTDTATEGVGDEASPVTDLVIADTHKMQVQNTVGLKQITVRFRSKAGSAFFVDVPIEIDVIAAPTALCNQPVTEYCGEMLLLNGQLLLTNLQDTESVPLVQDVAGTPGNPVTKDLIYVSVNAAIVGGTVEAKVRKYKYVADTADQGGVKILQVGSDIILLPLTTPAISPTPGPPYLTPIRATVAFNRAADSALDVALYSVTIQDQTLSGDPQLAAGPKFRDACFLNQGGLGGGDSCVYI